MRTPRVFVCYAPRAGLRCAVAYLSGERDAYGWFAGRSEKGFESAYFVLEDFYTPRETRYVAVPEEDLHGRWIRDEAMAHELAQLQDMVSHEWLFHAGDARAADEAARYAGSELASGGLNVRFERLNRLSKDQPNWTYYSPGCEHAVLKALSARWPLDYRIEQTAAA